MFADLKRMLLLTEGERGLFLAYVGVAVFGAGLAHTVVNNLGGQDEILRRLSAYDFWMILSGALGADAGLYAARDRFGQAGLIGVRDAIIGGVTATLVATVVAGTLALPGFGTMFGPFAAGVAFWKSPLLLAFWCTMLLSAHLLFAKWRQERQTLFAAPQDDGLPA